MILKHTNYMTVPTIQSMDCITCMYDTAGHTGLKGRGWVKLSVSFRVGGGMGRGEGG